MSVSRWFLVFASVLLIGFAGALREAPAAQAANGTLLGQVTFSSPCSGVGIAFDGTNLWYSCWASSPDLLRADAKTGQVTASYSMNGGLGALAYDAGRNAIWAGWGAGQTASVYLIPLDSAKNAQTKQLKFTTTGAVVCDLDDGLAYDQQDDTLYISDDCSTSIHHYSTSGTELNAFPWAGNACYNSGLAVGGNLLYEGSDGCTHIWAVDKTSKAQQFDFSSPGTRDEDLECDSHTFSGKTVMWSKDAYNSSAYAFEIPLGSCNAGGVPLPGKDDRVVIFVPGITSQSTCPNGTGFLDQAPRWIEPFLNDPQQPWIQNAVHISDYVYFSYSGNYCDGSTGEGGGIPQYAASDTCAGFDEVYYDRLKGLIERVTDRFKDRKTRVSIVAHSQGGLISSYLVGRLRQDAPDFLAQRVASVITFDSFPEGLPLADILHLWPPYWGPCGANSANIQDWNNNSYVSQTAREAAQPFNANAGPKCPGRDQACVKFYTIDAAGPPVPEQFTHIRGESNHAQYPGDHSQIWNDLLLGKQRFVACGVLLWDSCLFWEARVSQSQVTHSNVIVGPATTQMSVTSSFGSVVRMTLTSPDGTIYGPDGSGPVAAYDVTETSETYVIDNPAPGDWSVDLDGIDVPHLDGEVVPLALLVDGLVNAPPTLTVPSDQSVQYSDSLSFGISCSDPDAADVVSLSAAGLPSALTFTDNGDGTGTVTGTAQVAAGTYPVTFSCSDGFNAPETGSLNVFVTREDAVVTPSSSNPTAVKVNTAGGTAGPINLAANVTEATDEGTNGDISLAVPVTYQLIPLGPGTTYGCTATTSGGGIGGTLATSCTFSNVAVNVYDVHISIGGNYYQGSGDSVLAVYDPSLGFVTGGGSIMHNGVLANFGFNAKYLKGGKIQGSVLYIEHRSTGDVVLKSNAMSSLVVLGNTAYILGKATLNGVGNYSFMTTVIDNGEPGTGDQFGLQVKNPSAVIVTNLTFAPVTLAGGNVLVPHK